MIDPLDSSTLRKARRYVDMTQKELAIEVGLAPNTICDIEKGKHDPKLSDWARIVRVIQGKLEGVE